MSDPVHEQISELIKENKVVLFMKGNRHFPQCGFSAAVVRILDELLPQYKTVNVLTEPGIREGIKEFSKWPTIPQLYIDGEFVGGSDIVRDMASSGELAKALGVKVEAPKAPTLKVSASAAAAFKDASTADEFPRIEIGQDFQVELSIDKKNAQDIVVEVSGVTFLFDATSARRADGLAIDFVPGEAGGFKIDNPNEPPRVKSMSVQQLKEALDRKDDFDLYDVRPTAERDRAKLEQAVMLDESVRAKLQSADKSRMIVIHCHHGGRSRAAAEQLVKQGFRNVYNLEGGIDAWSQQIDSKIARY
ncbi:MAG TPA: Grx4 family monothiol glutaredoxin [Polyangiaceae bacterium]